MKHRHSGRLYLGELAILLVIVLVLMIVFLCVWPKYRVYSEELAGAARLKEAEWSKQILIEEAKAQQQASLLRAQAKVTLAKAQGQAEVERATTTAEANRIIGKSLKGNEAYARPLDRRPEGRQGRQVGAAIRARGGQQAAHHLAQPAGLVRPTVTPWH